MAVKTPQVPSTARKAAKPKANGQPRARQAARDDVNMYHLRLYVAGQTRKSLHAIANLRRICEDNLSGRYTIEVVDLLQHPQLARGDQILAIPTLVRKLPSPIKKIIGDLSQTDKVLLGLDVEPAAASRQA